MFDWWLVCFSFNTSRFLSFFNSGWLLSFHFCCLWHPEVDSLFHHLQHWLAGNLHYWYNPIFTDFNYVLGIGSWVFMLFLECF